MKHYKIFGSVLFAVAMACVIFLVVQVYILKSEIDKPAGLLKSPEFKVELAKACGIVVNAPHINAKVHLGPNNNLNISVTTKPEKDCIWTVFEGQAGYIEIKTKDGDLVGTGILKTNGEWMTAEPVYSEASVSLTKKMPEGTELRIKITEENPSGEGVIDILEIPVTVG